MSDKIRWDTVVPLVVGLSLLNVWSDMPGHSSAFLNSGSLIASAAANGRVFFLIGEGLCAFLFAIFPRQFRKMDDVLQYVFASLSVAATVIYAVFPRIQSDPVLLGALGAFGIGFGYGWMLIRLLCMLAQMERLSDAIWLSLISLLLKTVIDDLLVTIPDAAQVWVTAILPIVIVSMVALASRAFDRADTTPDLAELPKPDRTEMGSLLVLLILNAVLHAVTRSMSNLGYWGVGYAIGGSLLPAITVTVVLLIFIAYPTLVRESSMSMTLRFLPAFLALLGGFFLLDPQIVALLSIPDWVAQVLNLTVELYAHLLYWTIIVTAIRNLEYHPYRTAAIAITVLCISAIFLAVFLQQIADMNKVVVLVTMYVFIFVVILLFRGTKGGENISVNSNTVDANLRQTYMDIAGEHGLSPRETDVFILIAQGRSSSYIQNELFLSGGTVKTHTQHIYTKLGVHSRQDIITMVQRELGRGDVR